MPPRTSITEHILEIRFTPNARILDRRGDWAEALATEMSLPQWEIIENRLDLFTADRKQRAFVSFRNMGYIALDVPTAEYHADRAQRLIRFVLGLDGFANPLPVERIGLRGKYCVPYPGSFGDLRDGVSSKYVQLSQSLIQALGADVKLEDIGAPLNFSDAVGNFNTHCGAMQKEQLSQFFKDRRNLPDVALFYDVDYWQKSPALKSEKAIAALIHAFARAGWKRFEQVADLLVA